MYGRTFYRSPYFRIPSTVISTESVSEELIASLIKSQISQKNDMTSPRDQTLFLKKVILTRELLLQQVNFRKNASIITTFNDFIRKQIQSHC